VNEKRGIRLDNVTKRFAEVLAVNSVSFHVEEGEFMSLLGPSGCGKTTTLRIIAGFLRPDHGTIHAGGEEITPLPPFKRNIGLVFQNYALWPHMTVFENISFGLKLRKIKVAEIWQRVEEVIALTNLPGLEERFPRELSGGQQQRVALARVLVLKPAILLLDEPLSNLDRKLRVHMRVELRQLQGKLGMTTLYVTHDQEEALSMSDRVAIMDRGRISQIGTPNQIYEDPSCGFVADFVGSVNIMEGQIVEESGELATFKTREGLIFKISIKKALTSAGNLNLAIRPERVKVSHKSIEGDNVMQGEVKFVVYLGSLTRYHVELKEGFQITAECQNVGERFSIGDRVYLMIDGDHCNIIES